MRTQSIDTSPEAERVQIAILRKASVSQRFRRTASMSHLTMMSAQRYLQQKNAHVTGLEAMFLSVEHSFGKAITQELRQASEMRQIFPAFATVPMQSALFPVLSALKNVGITCALAGPLASCLYGLQQHVEQIHILADLDGVDATLLTEIFPAEFYVRPDDIHTALAKRSTITYYHLPLLFTIQMMFPQARLNEATMLKRARLLTLVEEEPAQPVLAPEDIALLTLERAREREAELAQQGRKEQADAIWNELLGVLKIQGPDLDLASIEQQASQFGLLPAMQRALEDAGLQG
jgi:hypothetical protein